MPLPLIIVGIGIAAGAYGVKKGLDAKDDFDTAERYNKKAEVIYNNAREHLETNRELTNSRLESLGELKVSIYEGSLADFVDVYSQIKNIDFNDKLNLGLLGNVDEQEMLDIKNTVLEMKEVLGGGVAALGSGALAGFGALGGVGMLASASTGTAIASLSGAAATNATLAWLGGGSLAAGGLGMTGGIAVLGGIVVGPVLAVGGMMLASKAEEAKYAAYENLDKAKAAADEMDAACVVLDGIYKRADEFIEILEPLDNIFKDYIDVLENIVVKSNDYRDYTQAEKENVMKTSFIAETVKNICDAPVIDENGKVAKESRIVLENAKMFAEKIRKV